MLQYRERMLDSCKKQQMLDATVLELDVEKANTARMQRQQVQMEADYAQSQQELTKMQARLAQEQVGFGFHWLSVKVKAHSSARATRSNLVFLI